MFIKHGFFRFLSFFIGIFSIFSVFFYAPVQVHAQTLGYFEPEVFEDETKFPDVVGRSVSSSPGASAARYVGNVSMVESSEFDFSRYMTEGSGIYVIEFDISTTFESSTSNNLTCYMRNMNCYLNNSDLYQQLSAGTSGGSGVNSYSFAAHRKFYVNSNTPTLRISYKATYLYTQPPGTITATASYSISNVTCSLLETGDSTDYQDGYNAGYASGQTSGYNSGYSNGYNSGYTAGQDSVDTDSYYEDGFQDGQNSVDTDSYYDAGYDDGYDVGFDKGKDSVNTDKFYQDGYDDGYSVAYDVGYEEGYEEGYDEAYDVGYSDAMDRISSWGADSSDYPIELTSALDQSVHFKFNVSPYAGDNYNYKLLDSTDWRLGCDFNPNHTYKIAFVLDSYNVSASTSSSNYHYDLLRTSVLNGSNIYPFSLVTGKKHIFYIPGDIVSNAFLFQVEFLNFVNLLGDGGNIGFYLYFDAVYDFYIYDCGPSGDTQNHIANQTDQLTNGFDSSAGDSLNTEFSGSLNEFQTAEDSLFTAAKSGLDDFAYVDFSSYPALVSAMSFVTSLMTSIFISMGGESGPVGIVLSVLFSVMLVSMAIGLYRYYQSKGGS